MTKHTSIRAALAAAALTLLATTAETMPEPVDLTNTSFDTIGIGKFKISRLGRDQDPNTDLRVTFDDATGFQAVSLLDGTMLNGTYEARGRRSNKLRFTLDNASLATVRDDVIDGWGELLLADRGRAGDGSIVMRNYKLRGKVNKAGLLKVKGWFRFRATETATGRSANGRYAIRLSGAQR